jgi:thiol-disulfide isomerase/thioredoxin
MRITWSLLAVLFMTQCAPAQKTEPKMGYQLDFKVDGCPEGKVVLAYYYGNKQYIKDSTRVSVSGQFSFKGDNSLDQGIYIVVMPPDNKYFEVVIDDYQHIKMEADYAKPIASMKVTGSEENKRFYAYLKYINDKKDVTKPWTDRIAELQKADSSGYTESAEFKQLRDKLAAVDTEVKNYKNEFMSKHPDAFMTKVFLASKDVEIPDAPILSNGRPDSLFQYRYYKTHFWDHVDFTDGRILRTPVFHGKLEQYMTKTVYQIPDSINKEADILIEKARADNDLFKYVVYWITQHFETSKQMGMDAVFVHMAKNYYMTGQAFWADSSTVAKIGERAQKLDWSLLGKVAPNLRMQDVNGNWHELHKIKADYTIAYFWDPECGHCKKVTPVVYDFYQKFKDELGVGVFAVGTQVLDKRDEWIKYLNEKKLDWINVSDPEQKTAYKYFYDIYSTPVIYLLDKDKKIIAKRLGAEDLEDFIRRHKKLHP